MLATALCAVAGTVAGTVGGTVGGTAAHADSRQGSTWIATQVCGPPYVTGDPDLGPANLPRTGYLGQLLHGYKPLGNLTPQHFLSRYWDYAANNYRYPPDSGFGRSGDYPNGRLLVKTTFLQPGMELDRFGGYSGAFLSPRGDLFAKRSLPPRNLNTNPADPQHLCNYHAFRVLKSFRVDVGLIAPAFQQSGGGTQYHLLSRYLPEAPQTSEEVPVSWLLANGYLEEIMPVLLTDLRPAAKEAATTNAAATATKDATTAATTTGDDAAAVAAADTAAADAEAADTAAADAATAMDSPATDAGAVDRSATDAGVVDSSATVTDPTHNAATDAAAPSADATDRSATKAGATDRTNTRADATDVAPDAAMTDAADAASADTRSGWTPLAVLRR